MISLNTTSWCTTRTWWCFVAKLTKRNPPASSASGSRLTYGRSANPGRGHMLRVQAGEPVGVDWRRYAASLQLTWAPTSILYADWERFNSLHRTRLRKKNNCSRRGRVGHLEIANVKMSCMRPIQFLQNSSPLAHQSWIPPSAPCQGCTSIVLLSQICSYYGKIPYKVSDMYNRPFFNLIVEI